MEEDENIEDSEEEYGEVEVIEISLDEEEIEELIEKLNKLKQEKTHFHFDVDEDNELLIRHEDEGDLE